jgi:nucleotide-binding universal stress UspA family protein
VGAEVVAVHAVGLLEPAGAGAPQPAQPHREEIRRRFESEWCKPLDDAGIPSRRLLRDGSPVAVLLGVADEVDADVLVVGSRGVGAFPQMLLGSTSTQVAQASTRPVVIIPAASQ